MFQEKRRPTLTQGGSSMGTTFKVGYMGFAWGTGCESNSRATGHCPQTLKCLLKSNPTEQRPKRNFTKIGDT